MMRGILRWTRRLSFTAGILALAYCGYVEVNAWRFQQEEKVRLDTAIGEQLSAPIDGVKTGDLIGRMDIPTVGISVVVVEGATEPELSRAAGHIAGTANPGEPGNTAIAAHRDTYFRPLRNIEYGAQIYVTTPRGKFGYRVVSTQVVSPRNVEVLKPDTNETLTLVTCYPFYFVGNAPKRFIVKAERVL